MTLLNVVRFHRFPYLRNVLDLMALGIVHQLHQKGHQRFGLYAQPVIGQAVTMTLFQMVQNTFVFQIPVEKPFKVIHGDDWLLAEIVVLEVQDELRLVIDVFLHFL